VSAGAFGTVNEVWKVPEGDAVTVVSGWLVAPLQLICTCAPARKVFPDTVTEVPGGPEEGLRLMLADGWHAQARAAQVSDTASTPNTAGKVQRRLEPKLSSP
jgi:hypothetical protein